METPVAVLRKFLRFRFTARSFGAWLAPVGIRGLVALNW